MSPYRMEMVFKEMQNLILIQVITNNDDKNTIYLILGAVIHRKQ